MSMLVATEFVTLDGVMEALSGEPELNEVLEAEAHLLGRVTHESFAAAWAVREGELADKLNSMPKYVVSSTLEEPLEWSNSRLVRGDAPGESAS